MNNDLAKIATIRSRNRQAGGAMDYLLSPIRRELEDRIKSSQREFDSGLVIDFKSGDLKPGNLNSRTQLSILEIVGIANPGSEFKENEFDCVVLNLQGGWLNFEEILGMLKTAMRPGAELYFSTFGPDTLVELESAWRSVDDCPHVLPFTDMHHLGDILVHTGFEKPIVDADWIYIDYPDVDLLFQDLKSEGFTNVLSDRRKTLTGKNRFAKFRNELQSRSDPEGVLRVTFELVYGYARLPVHAEGSVLVNLPGEG